VGRVGLEKRFGLGPTCGPEPHLTMFCRGLTGWVEILCQTEVGICPLSKDATQAMHFVAYTIQKARSSLDAGDPGDQSGSHRNLHVLQQLEHLLPVVNDKQMLMHHLQLHTTRKGYL